MEHVVITYVGHAKLVSLRFILHTFLQAFSDITRLSIINGERISSLFEQYIDVLFLNINHPIFNFNFIPKCH